ncbi:MAG: hypothetical protein H6737_05660 [Alphaproteobacteria bacterium]|nr:hypothetical protein [Alphaproteobacteria bacterium]
MLTLFLALALAEEDGRPEWSLETTVDGVVWTLEARVLRRDGVVLAEDVLGVPAFAGGVVAFARVAEAPVGTELVVIAHGERRVLVGPDVRPDRVALAPDGQTVAYVSGMTGWASVYVQALDGAPRQLTNIGLARRKSTPPEGFTAPPHEGPPVFEGDALCWTADTRICVPWRAP